MPISTLGQFNPFSKPSGAPLGVSRWSIFRSWESRAALVLLVACVISGFATYAALTDRAPFNNSDPDHVIWLLNIDLIILLLLLVLVARRLVGLWSGRKRKLAGSGLHVRLVYIFSLMAAVPVIIMTFTSAFFFNFGVQTWFSERVSTAIEESQAVAQAYFEEHRNVIRADTLAMANDLDRAASFLIENDQALEKVVRTQSVLRNLSEAMIFDSRGRVLARSALTFSLEFEEVPRFAMRQANDGEVVIMTNEGEDRIRALVKLNNFTDTYLFVGRMVDPKVLSHMAKTREATEDYANLQTRYSTLEVTVTMIFIVIGLTLLMGAIWYGLILSRDLVSPITSLIAAADQVRAGDLTVRVPEQKLVEEFDYLASAFNRMTRQIQEQQNELIVANRQIDRRRRLTESVLTGVSSGVIGIDARNIINLANVSALTLLGLPENRLVGTSINDVMPDIAHLIAQAHARPQKTTQADIPFVQKSGAKRIFLVRIVIEVMAEEDVGAIVTFDDITELQSAQRKAAWSDVARRIAHEIKNPLTPIQLSAERLKRKYAGQISDDPESFVQYTDTIIRNVGDIGRMVNEFSSFARMPEPILREGQLVKDVGDALFLHRQAHPKIAFRFLHEENETFNSLYDAQQIRQAINNLIQNSVDSIQMRQDKEGPETPARIDVLLTRYGSDEIAIVVTDSGLGLPKNENPIHLTEPYVTHKPKGTGLGLAIVKKIMEDHEGSLLLMPPEWLKSMKDWEDLQGAAVVLLLPARSVKDKTIAA
jgi:two-component system nitrogen regulation sensor histidine kinase NtrY